MSDDLLELEELGWQALSSPDPVTFCEGWLADDALVIVPGMVIDRAAFLQALAHEQPWETHQIEEPRKFTAEVGVVGFHDVLGQFTHGHRGAVEADEIVIRLLQIAFGELGKDMVEVE